MQRNDGFRQNIGWGSIFDTMMAFRLFILGTASLSLMGFGIERRTGSSTQQKSLFQ